MYMCLVALCNAVSTLYLTSLLSPNVYMYALHLHGFCVFIFVFFFSSRRRHTRSLCDWSSDVCSSDLDRCDYDQQNTKCMNATHQVLLMIIIAAVFIAALIASRLWLPRQPNANKARYRLFGVAERSEERRVGKECRSRWATEYKQKRRQ